MRTNWSKIEKRKKKEIVYDKTTDTGMSTCEITISHFRKLSYMFVKIYNTLKLLIIKQQLQ